MKSIALLCLLFGNLFSANKFNPSIHSLIKPETNVSISDYSASTHLAAIQTALNGYSCLQETNHVGSNEYMIIIDYSLPSIFPRLLVYNLKQQRVITRMHVAHGRGSGLNRADFFSNQPASFKSSLGFFKIGEVYIGKHGRSVRLIGLESGINDQALNRGIVIHSADYVEDGFIQSMGRAGRSLGCPAVSASNLNRLMPYLQESACLFIYAPQASYFQQSRFFR
jgi:hypothetical protein